MSSEIIQYIAYDNYGDFQHVHFIFSQKFISLFWGSFNDETDLRVKVMWCEDQLLCVCVLLRHLGVFLWVSLAHTYTNPPITTLSNNLSSRWQIHTHTTQNQILSLEYLTYYNSLLPFTWYFNSLPTTANNNYFLNVFVWAHEKET
jgi:hypothetical protein